MTTLKDRILVLKTNYRLMQVKKIAECSNGEHSAILLTFIKLPFVIKIFVLSIFEWPFYTGFTVYFPKKQHFYLRVALLKYIMQITETLVPEIQLSQPM